MCKATGKQWNDYFRLDSTGDFLDALEEQTGIPVCDLVVSVKGQGTWVHRRVAIHLARAAGVTAARAAGVTAANFRPISGRAPSR